VFHKAASPVFPDTPHFRRMPARMKTIYA